MHSDSSDTDLNSDPEVEDCNYPLRGRHYDLVGFKKRRRLFPEREVPEPTPGETGEQPDCHFVFAQVS